MTEWILVGFPISKPSETHIFVGGGDDIVRRCDTSVSATEEDVCQISDDELRGLLEKDETEFCGECIRYMTQITPM